MTDWIPTPAELTAIREGLELTQKQMAELLGKTTRRYGDKERGTADITLTDARAIRDIAAHISLLRLGIPVQ